MSSPPEYRLIADAGPDAQPVTWNDAAAAVALNWAKGCKMVHSGTKGYGENLAAGAGGGYSVTSAFNSWASEGKPAEGGYNHYSQVVWKATTGIGCGEFLVRAIGQCQSAKGCCSRGGV